MLCNIPCSSSLRTRLMSAALGRVDHLPVVNLLALPYSSITACLLSAFSLSHCAGSYLLLSVEEAKVRRTSSSIESAGTVVLGERFHRCRATPMHSRTRSHRRNGLKVRVPVDQPCGGDGGCVSRTIRFLDLRGSGDSKEMAESVGEGGGSRIGGGLA